MPSIRLPSRLAGALGLAAFIATSASLAAPASLTVGSLELTACGTHGAYCGYLPRPLDPLGQVPGTISIYFEFYPHREAGDATGVLDRKSVV